MKLDLTYAQSMPAKMIYDFEDAQGHKRTIIVHPNKSVSFHTEVGSIQFDKDMAKDVIALLTQFVETGDIDPESISEEGVSIADAIEKGLVSFVEPPDPYRVAYDRGAAVIPFPRKPKT